MKDLKKIAVRASAVVTGSYVAGTVIGTNDPQVLAMDQLIAYINITLGSLTSVEVKIEFSPDGGANYYQETNEVVGTTQAVATTLEHSYAATGKYRLPIPLKDGLVKISVKGTGTVTNSLVAIDATVSQNF